MLSWITYLLVKSDIGSCCLQREKGQLHRENICRRIVGSDSCVFKAQNPTKHHQELERNVRQFFRTKQNNKMGSKIVVSTMCLRTIALSQNLLDLVGNAVV